jgi:carboxymethylenebutenolidase
MVTDMRRFLLLVLALAAVSAAAALPAQSQASDPQTVAVASGALTLHGLLWRPAGAGPFPAVLFNHGSGPSSDPGKPTALGPVFARHGYLFLYLYRRGAGLSADQGTDSEALMNAARAERGEEGRNEVQLQLLETELGDVLAGVTFLRARPDVDARRIAAAGHSFGGQLTLLLAERDAGIRAAVVFGSAAVSWSSSPKLRARLLAAVDRTDVPVFFIYAANDFSVEPGKALAAEMSRLHKPSMLKIYPPVGQSAREGHDFAYSGLSTWEPDVFAFLDERLRR